jgi:hypothetical protein
LGIEVESSHYLIYRAEGSTSGTIGARWRRNGVLASAGRGPFNGLLQLTRLKL